MNFTHHIQTHEQTVTTTVTAYPDTVNDWICDIANIFRSAPTVMFGLDIEWKPTRRPGEVNRAATLQICAGNRCLIIQLLHIREQPYCLDWLLRNPRYVFAGVEIRKDAEKLNEDYGLVIENLYDVRAKALDRSPERLSRCPGLKELAREVANLSMAKPRRVTMSDWSKQVLTEQQIRYACLDAYASNKIGLILYFDLEWTVQLPCARNT